MSPTRPCVNTVALSARCLMVSFLMVQPAIAQRNDAPTRGMDASKVYDIPAGSLGDALSTFAASAGMPLSFDPALTRDKTTPGLRGYYSVQEGFALLLAGSGLRAVRADDGNVSIRPLPPGSDAASTTPVSTNTLRKIAVRDTELADGITEGSGSYTTRALGVGGKTARDPKEIQQSVSVVTSQRIHDQALTTSEEALGQATGVTLTQSGGYASNAAFFARGFSMGIQTDGGAAGVNYLWYNTGLPDLAMVDHIEVLRGSDGLFLGSGNPGGTVNVVRKRPLDRNQVVFEAQAGRWDRMRLQVDATGPLGWDGRLRGRFVAAEEERDYFYDNAESDKSVLYGVVEADVTGSTMVSVGFSYEQQDRTGLYFGLPRYSTGADLKLSRSECLCTEWSSRDDLARELFVKVEQSLGDSWRLKLNLGKQWLDYEYQQGNAAGAIDPSTRTGPLLSGSRTDVANNVKLADVTLDGRFEVFGLGQELVLGANWQDMFSDGTGVSYYPTRPAVDVFAFNPRAFPQPATPASYIPLLPFGGQKQSGVYATLRTDWTDTLHSVLGLRNSNYEYLYTLGNVYFEDKNVRTPYAGLSFDVTQAVTVYSSYAEIYESQAGSVTETGAPLDPVEGKTFEVGAKGSWLDGDLTASLALYEIHRDNASIRVSTSPTLTNCCFVAAAKSESRGVDTEITGQLLPGWQASLGYTYNVNEFKSGYGTRNGTAYTPRSPKHLLKLWTMAQLPGAWSALRVGGGVNWQSENFASGTAATYNPVTDRYDGPAVAFKYTQGAYAVASVRGEYRINAQWSAAVNINNLFDETYYQTVSTSNTGNYYGEPRNVLLSVNSKW